MEVSYIKDLHNNYLLIAKKDGSSKESYSIQMLQENTIKGIIRPKPRIIDNQTLYYYDITSMQPIDTIYIRNKLNCEQLKNIFLNISNLIDQAYEHLLNENDLILVPEYIYIELATGQANVCYLPGNDKDIRKQIADLIEYLMNKVDYKDKEAVLYVYNLYAVCRVEGFSFNEFLMAVKESKTDNSIKDNNPEQKKASKLKNTDNIETVEAQIPLMMEKILDDEEQYYYPLSAYIYTVTSLISAILILVISIKSKILYTALGSRLDYGKLMVLLVILLCIVGYLMRYIWDKKNRLTRIISRQEYIDPRDDYKIKNPSTDEPEQSKEFYEYTGTENKPKLIEQPEDRSNSTVLLNAGRPSLGCYLKPEYEEIYETIEIKEFPFVIGNLKSNVDYCLDKEVVSRYHVKITKEEDVYYITDLNSTNGTCLNEKPLACYQRYEIIKEDKVAIAGIKYSFQKHK